MLYQELKIEFSFIHERLQIDKEIKPQTKLLKFLFSELRFQIFFVFNHKEVYTYMTASSITHFVQKLVSEIKQLSSFMLLL